LTYDCFLCRLVSDPKKFVTVKIKKRDLIYFQNGVIYMSNKSITAMNLCGFSCVFYRNELAGK
jgi:hypothetical protein